MKYTLRTVSVKGFYHLFIYFFKHFYNVLLQCVHYWPLNMKIKMNQLFHQIPNATYTLAGNKSLLLHMVMYCLLLLCVLYVIF